eukprot:4823307-Pyramimonas_sp.AAC.1
MTGCGSFKLLRTAPTAGVEAIHPWNSLKEADAARDSAILVPRKAHASSNLRRCKLTDSGAC